MICVSTDLLWPLHSTTHKVKMRGWTGSMVALGGLTLGSPMGLGGKDHPCVSWKTGSLFQVFRGGLGMPFLCIQLGSDQTWICIYTHIQTHTHIYIYIYNTQLVGMTPMCLSFFWWKPLPPRIGVRGNLQEPPIFEVESSRIYDCRKMFTSFNPLKSMISPYLWLKSS